MTAVARLAAALEARHNEVVSTTVEESSLLAVTRERYPMCRVLVLDQISLDENELHTLDLEGVHAVVVGGWRATYEWSAREAAHERGVALLTGPEFFGALNSTDLRDYDLSHVQYFFDRVSTHSLVKGINRLGPELADVVRDGISTLRVYIADIYRLGEADVAEIHDRHPDVDLIANLSSWNEYTPEAAEEARRRSIHVFDLSGLYGALYLDGAKLLDYVPKADR